MKSIIIILVILGYTIAYSQPQIVIEGNDIYNWGKINPQGKPLTAKVKIFNKGNKTLKINKVKPGCGCTTAPLDKNIIEPNGFATLSISLNVSNDGPVKKSINIESNDPKSPTKNLVIKAEIVRPIGLSQKYLNFGKLEINKESLAIISISNNTDKTILIKEIIIEPKEISLNINKNSKILSKKDIILEAKYTPKRSSDLSGRIIIKTNNTEIPTIELPVYGNMKKVNSK